MEYTQLSPLEVRDLINKYKSDLRKLDFQRLKTSSIIKELEGYATEIEEALSIEEATIRELPSSTEPETEQKETKKAAPKRRGRPPKSETAKADAKKEAAPKPEKKKKRRGRPPGSKSKAKAKSKTAAKGQSKTKEKATKSKAEPKASNGKEGYRLSEWDEFVLNSLKDKQKALTTSEFTEIGVANPSIKSGAAQIKTKLNRSLHKLANKKGVLVKVEHSGRGFAYALQDWLDSKGQLPKKYAKEN